MNELLLLKLRAAIVQKEGYVACANQQLNQGGWLCDWQSYFRESDEVIQGIVHEIEEERRKAAQ